MKQRNIYWIIAGLINLFTAFMHAIGGQLTLVNPLLDSNLNNQCKTEWLGAWHCITILLFVMAYYILKFGFAKSSNANIELLKMLGILHLLFCLPFILSSVYMQVFAPQWILFLPMGVLVFLGIKKHQSSK